MQTFVTFPELDGFVMESTALPRLLEGETVELDAQVFRGEGDAIDAVATLSGAFLVEHARIAFGGAFGALRGVQHVTLRSKGAPAPAWREVAHA